MQMFPLMLLIGHFFKNCWMLLHVLVQDIKGIIFMILEDFLKDW